jgi:hypothetical protein
VTQHFRKVNFTKFVEKYYYFLLQIDLQRETTNYFNKKETMLQQDPKNVINNIVSYQN